MCPEPPPAAPALPTVPGSYLLVIRTSARLDLAVGRLGPRTFPRGWHVYAGSARGGLAGRLRHHLADDRTVHWHVDALRQAGTVAEVWVVAGRAPLECALARAVAALPGARLSPRFGSTDCRCPGHLVSFSRRPALGGVWPGLARLHTIFDHPTKSGIVPVPRQCVTNAREVIQLVTETMRERGEPLPETATARHVLTVEVEG